MFRTIDIQVLNGTVQYRRKLSKIPFWINRLSTACDANKNVWRMYVWRMYVCVDTHKGQGPQALWDTLMRDGMRAHVSRGDQAGRMGENNLLHRCGEPWAFGLLGHQLSAGTPLKSHGRDQKVWLYGVCVCVCVCVRVRVSGMTNTILNTFSVKWLKR